MSASRIPLTFGAPVRHQRDMAMALLPTSTRQVPTGGVPHRAVVLQLHRSFRQQRLPLRFRWVACCCSRSAHVTRASSCACPALLAVYAAA